MIYGSVCSGIEAASVAWHPLGWRPAFFSEIEAFPRAVLKHHYPDVPLHGDFTTIREGQYAAIDVLVGGTPCQSFSVAGLRGGLADDRGNLALEYLRLAQRLRPEWLVWENVPGVLSSNGGRDFGSILGGLVELGYGFAYRVLDAQYVRTHGFLRAVPQRRRRVFLVGHLGDWRRAAAVLFERESLQGHPAPGRQAGQRPAPTLSARPSGGGGLGTDFDCDGGLVAKCLTSHATRIDAETETFVAFAQNQLGEVRVDDVIGTLNTNSNASGRNTPMVAHALRADGFDASEDGTGRGTLLVPTIAFSWQTGGTQGMVVDDELSMTLIKDQTPAVCTGWRVRRLTPTECERLQGFPDGYTAVPYRGGMAADGPRYKALGNSMACNVMRWIGRRIEAVAARSQALEAAE
jgi:DNA (cytosine-5)-methyltransferase 1